MLYINYKAPNSPPWSFGFSIAQVQQLSQIVPKFRSWVGLQDATNGPYQTHDLSREILGHDSRWFYHVFTWNMVKSVVNVRWFLWMTMQRKCEKGWFRELILTFDGVCSGFWSFRSYILFCKIIYLRIGSGFWDFLSPLFNREAELMPTLLNQWFCFWSICWTWYRSFNNMLCSFGSFKRFKPVATTASIMVMMFLRSSTQVSWICAGTSGRANQCQFFEYQ